MRTVHHRSLALVTAFALAAAPSLVIAAPATTSSVSGRVYAADLKTPAAGLTVQAVPDGAKEALARSTTDARGRFQLQGLPAGKYLLVLLDEAGTPLAAAPHVMAQANSSVTLALPPPGALAPAQSEEKKEGEPETKKSEKSGFATWVSTPAGATIVLVASAVLVAWGADQLTDDDPDTVEIPATSPSLPR
jgi:hypothetical protein